MLGVMTRIVTFLLAAVVVSACSLRQTSPLAGVLVGMSAEAAISQMRPQSSDWGRVYWGGSGASRLYFQTSSTQQVWLEVSGAPDFAVTAIGAPEPKTEWTHHSGDSITVR